MEIAWLLCGKNLSLAVVVFEGLIYIDAALWVRMQILTYPFPKLKEIAERGWVLSTCCWGFRLLQGGACLVNDTHHWEPHPTQGLWWVALGTNRCLAKPSQAEGRSYLKSSKDTRLARGSSWSEWLLCRPGRGGHRCLKGILQRPLCSFIFSTLIAAPYIGHNDSFNIAN